MATEKQAKDILCKTFPSVHVGSALLHFAEATSRYQKGDWEGSLVRVGKFVEAVIKCLAVYCGKTLPRSRDFKVGSMAHDLGQADRHYDEVARILIPRACVFAYDIVSNRGARHDPDEVDPNEMDANVAIPVISWMLAEMIRFASEKKDMDTAASLVSGLSDKKYPYFEQIGKRTYINIRGLKSREVGLLILSAVYPGRIKRDFLIDLVKRHGSTKNNATVAVHRLQRLVDDDNDNWKLRGIGLREAEEVLIKTR